ncbi:hypothetical protein IFM89_021303 [Coptis chinensis]|uniref:F-box domain-containing protein n=1 Tax=Coptis chinensis TaxID=261450 RepID=A0A835LV01_9MAGN|nr:hypothetical protein IFM89_021303 [Coptis chinensis]
MEKNRANNDLPHEIIELILLRLPVKSILRFRNSWRKIQDIPYSIPYITTTGAFTNDALHWTAFPLRSFNAVIIAYDVGGDSFREVPYPDHLISYSCKIDAAILDDNLCMMWCDKGPYELWMMEEYGAIESWTKKFIIRLDLELQYTSPGLVPLCFIKDGATLVLDSIYDLRLFELGSKILKRWPVSTKDGFKSCCFEATIYTESLVAIE